MFRLAVVTSLYAGIHAGLMSQSVLADTPKYAPLVAAKQLPFAGETALIYIQQTDPDQSVAIVKSCAPFPEGCANPQIKARSIKNGKPGAAVWEFADLRNCADAEPLVSALLASADTTPETINFQAGPERVKTAKQHTAEDLIERLSSCLSTSYMTPPWERNDSE